ACALLKRPSSRARELPCRTTGNAGRRGRAYLGQLGIAHQRSDWSLQSTSVASRHIRSCRGATDRASAKPRRVFAVLEAEGLLAASATWRALKVGRDDYLLRIGLESLQSAWRAPPFTRATGAIIFFSSPMRHADFVLLRETP